MSEAGPAWSPSKMGSEGTGGAGEAQQHDDQSGSSEEIRTGGLMNLGEIKGRGRN